MINPGFDIRPTEQPMGFAYGPGVFGPEVELRALNAIRKSLRDPDCEGPDPVYSIAMDVGRSCDREAMLKRNLLYGAVTYAGGRLGREPVRSQGHVHAVSPSCGMSTPEVYEIWAGKAVIYRMFEDAKAHLAEGGRLFLVIRKQQGAPSALKFLKELYAEAETIERDGGYWVIACRK